MSSGNPMLDGILWGGSRWPGTNITYYFAPNSPLSPYDDSWSSFEQNGFRTALQSWANVANLTCPDRISTENARVVELHRRVPGLRTAVICSLILA